MARGRWAHCFHVLPAAEANAISEDTDTLHLSPPGSTEYVGQGAEKAPEVCEHSCEALGSMIKELSGLHVVVNQLQENLRRVVGARQPRRPHDQGARVATEVWLRCR